MQKTDTFLSLTFNCEISSSILKEQRFMMKKKNANVRKLTQNKLGKITIVSFMNGAEEDDIFTKHFLDNDASLLCVLVLLRR